MTQPDKYPPEIISTWGLHSSLLFSTRVQILVDRFSFKTIPEGTTRIIICQEPLKHRNKFKNILLDKNNKKYYSYIFTYDQDILDSNDKAIFFLCISSWIKNYSFPKKKFGVSTLVGGKKNKLLEGYELRHLLWSKQEEIKLNKDFYLSSSYRYEDVEYEGGLVLTDDKSVMFDNQFHIAIENTSMKNMFTEKILDCFQTKTIPIYYGCKNIGDFFNPEGVFSVRTLNEIVEVCNSLTKDSYNDRLSVVEENYNISKKYISTTDILDQKLLEICK